MSDINVNFTINQFNADLSIDPAPNVTMSIADPMVANFFIEGAVGANPAGNITELQYKTSNTTFGASNALSFLSVANTGPYDSTSTLYLGKNTGNVLNNIEIYAGGNSGRHRIDSIYSGAFKTFNIRAGTDPNIGHVFLIAGADATSTNAGTTGGNLNLFAGGALNAGAGGIGGSVNIRAGNATADLTNYSSGNVSLLTFGGNVSLLSSGALQINGSTGNSGQVLTSAGSGSAPTWTNIGNISSINLNGNGSQVLAGNGSWVAQSGGSGGFSGVAITANSAVITSASTTYVTPVYTLPTISAGMAFRAQVYGLVVNPDAASNASIYIYCGPNGTTSDTPIAIFDVGNLITDRTFQADFDIVFRATNQAIVTMTGSAATTANYTATVRSAIYIPGNIATSSTYMGIAATVLPQTIPKGTGTFRLLQAIITRTL